MNDIGNENGIPFEDALSQLEQIVRSLDAGQAKLETALESYEKGVRLLRHCHGILKNAERRIEILKKVSSDGVMETERALEQDFLSDANLPGQHRTAESGSDASDRNPSGHVRKKRVRKTTILHDSEQHDDIPFDYE